MHLFVVTWRMRHFALWVDGFGVVVIPHLFGRTHLPRTWVAWPRQSGGTLVLRWRGLLVIVNRKRGLS